MKLFDLIKKDEYLSSEIEMSTRFSSIASSANTLSQNCLYILENHELVPDFSSVTPAAIVVCENCSTHFDIPKIIVKDVRAASALIYSRFFGIDYDRLKIIGITGTNGKTTTARMTYHILKESGKKVGFIGTGVIEINGTVISDANYFMTTPPPEKLYPAIKKMQDMACSHIIMEVSSHAIAQKRILPIPFEYAAFTNLSEEHRDYHKSIDEYYETKKQLFKQAKKAVVNIDDFYARKLVKEIDNEIITAGIIWRGDIFVTNIENRGLDGAAFYYHGKNFTYRAELTLPGAHNIYNAMIASCLCIDMGIPPCEVKNTLKDLKKIYGRAEIIKDEITVIIDYAHTKIAFENILKTVSSAKGSYKLILVFGCGGNRDKNKRCEMGSIAEKYANEIILTSDNSRTEETEDIINDIVQGISSKKYTICKDREKAVYKAILEATAGDIVAILGKGCENYIIDKNGFHPYSDKKTAIKALELRKNES